MARLIAWKLGNHGVRTGGTTRMTSAGGPSARYGYGYTRRFPKVIGHRDTGVTSCPGEQLYYQLPELRERVGERRPTGIKDEMAALLPEARDVLARAATPSPARSQMPTGCRIVAASVELQRLRRTGWKRLEDAVTDENGDFAATATFKRYTILRWEFEGDDTYRPFRGDGVAVAVAPLLTLDASATDPETDEQIDLSGTIAPRADDGPDAGRPALRRGQRPLAAGRTTGCDSGARRLHEAAAVPRGRGLPAVREVRGRHG